MRRWMLHRSMRCTTSICTDPRSDTTQLHDSAGQSAFTCTQKDLIMSLTQIDEMPKIEERSRKIRRTTTAGDEGSSRNEVWHTQFVLVQNVKHIETLTGHSLLVGVTFAHADTPVWTESTLLRSFKAETSCSPASMQLCRVLFEPFHTPSTIAQNSHATLIQTHHYDE